MSRRCVRREDLDLAVRDDVEAVALVALANDVDSCGHRRARGRARGTRASAAKAPRRAAWSAAARSPRREPSRADRCRAGYRPAARANSGRIAPSTRRRAAARRSRRGAARVASRSRTRPSGGLREGRRRGQEGRDVPRAGAAFDRHVERRSRSAGHGEEHQGAPRARERGQPRNATLHTASAATSEGASRAARRVVRSTTQRGRLLLRTPRSGSRPSRHPDPARPCASSTARTSRAPIAMHSAPRSTSRSLACGSRRTNERDPRRLSSGSSASPHGRHRPLERRDEQAPTRQPTPTSANTIASEPTASTRPVNAGAARMLMLSIQPDTTFVAVSPPVFARGSA